VALADGKYDRAGNGRCGLTWPIGDRGKGRDIDKDCSGSCLRIDVVAARAQPAGQIVSDFRISLDLRERLTKQVEGRSQKANY
jgi:hypothetical protein